MPAQRRPKPRPPQLRSVYAGGDPRPGGLVVRSLALGEWMPPCLVERPRGRADWLVAAFLQDVMVGTREGMVPASATSVLVWRPGMPQRYGDPRRDWSHHWIHLDGDGVSAIAKACGLPAGRPLPGQDLPRFAAVLREIDAELGRPQPDQRLVGDLVRLLLHRVARDAHDQAAGDVPPALLAVHRQLLERYAAPHSLAGLARMAGCSPTHLCAAFRRHFGVPPIELLIRTRIAHARELLAEPGYPVSAAARAVGYPDPRSFARLVRRRLGIGLRALRARPA